MTSFFIAAAAVLVLAIFPLAVVALRGSYIAGLIALEVAGILTTLALICYSVGSQSTSSTSLAVLTAVLTWAGALVYVRLMAARRP